MAPRAPSSKIRLAPHCGEHPVRLVAPEPRGGEAEPRAASSRASPLAGEWVGPTCPPNGSIRQDVVTPRVGGRLFQGSDDGILSEQESDKCWGLGEETVVRTFANSPGVRYSARETSDP